MVFKSKKMLFSKNIWSFSFAFTWRFNRMNDNVGCDHFSTLIHRFYILLTRWNNLFPIFQYCFLFLSLKSYYFLDGETIRVLVNTTAQLKCDVSTNAPNDKALLVVWYKDNLPIYRWVNKISIWIRWAYFCLGKSTHKLTK